MKRRTFLKSSGAVLAAAAIPASMSSMSRMDEITREALRTLGIIHQRSYVPIGQTDLLLSMQEFEERYINPAIRVLRENLDQDILGIT